MTLASLLTQPVTILTPGAGTADAHGVANPDWVAATSTDELGRLEQMTSTEVTIGRDTVIVDGRLFLFPDSAITGAARVTHASGTYEVAGAPALESTPRGPHHYEVMLRSVDG